MHCIHGVVGGLILAISNCALAAEVVPVSETELEQPAHFSFLVENDMWGHPASDRNYTMGVTLAWSKLAGKKRNPLLQAVEGINAALGVSTGLTNDTPTHIMVASTNFTPKDITQKEPIVGDRPYGKQSVQH